MVWNFHSFIVGYIKKSSYIWYFIRVLYLLYHESIDNGDDDIVKIDVSNWNNGLYFLNLIKEGSEIKTVKFSVIK